MPDISMCGNKNCPSFFSCYRAMATPNPHRQAYSGFMFDPETGKCEQFIEVEND